MLEWRTKYAMLQLPIVVTERTQLQYQYYAKMTENKELIIDQYLRY